MTLFFLLTFAAYAMTFIVSSSSLLEPAREWCKVKLPWLRIGSNKHMVECRMCCGFWLSLLVCGVCGEWLLVLPVYGASYFLATQER